MQKAIVINSQFLTEMVESFHKSDFAKLKLENAKKSYAKVKDKIELEKAKINS